MTRSPTAPLLAAVLVALTSTACLSDGGNGENGLVRFSLVSDFVATEGLDHPVVAGGTVMIALQRPESSAIPNVVDPPTFTNLELVVKGVSGAAPVAYPAGIAQYGVYFPGEGEARLVATQDGQELDWIRMTAKKPDHLALQQWGSAVFDGSEDGVCGRIGEVDISTYKLAPNAAVYAYVVPFSGSDPMIGLQQLTVTSVGDGAALIDATLLGQGLPAHAFQVVRKPGETSLADIVVKVRDSANAIEATQAIHVRNDQDDTNCN